MDVIVVMVGVLVGVAVSRLAALGGTAVLVELVVVVLAAAVLDASLLAQRTEEHFGVPRVARHGDLPPQPAQKL